MGSLGVNFGPDEHWILPISFAMPHPPAEGLAFTMQHPPAIGGEAAAGFSRATVN
jgi:hypothetical protein